MHSVWAPLIFTANDPFYLNILFFSVLNLNIVKWRVKLFKYFFFFFSILREFNWSLLELLWCISGNIKKLRIYWSIQFKEIYSFQIIAHLFILQCFIWFWKKKCFIWVSFELMAENKENTFVVYFPSFPFPFC